MHDYEDTLHEVLNRVYRNTDDCEMRISKDCYKLIREALEKQIPKKAKNITTTVYYKQGRCPNCNALLKNTMNIFCSDCGQALDWSEDAE